MSITVSNRRQGELVINAPQSEIDAIISGCDCSKVTVQGHVRNKPVPLGIPTMNFANDADDDAKLEQPVANSSQTHNKRSDGKPTPLGIPVMTWD